MASNIVYDYLKAIANLQGTILRYGVDATIGNLHPAFAQRLAEAIDEARHEGIDVTIQSAYRRPADLEGYFKDKFKSAHSYGLAVDVVGIGNAGSDTAKRWYEIATAHGLFNPWGPSHVKEFNHYQLIPERSIEENHPLRQTIAANGPIDLDAMWAASGVPVPQYYDPLAGRLRPASDNFIPHARTLGRGMNGLDVKELQEELALRSAEVFPTGVFDAATDSAVRKYLQEPYGLMANGIVGADTRKAQRDPFAFRYSEFEPGKSVAYVPPAQSMFPPIGSGLPPDRITNLDVAIASVPPTGPSQASGLWSPTLIERQPSTVLVPFWGRETPMDPPVIRPPAEHPFPQSPSPVPTPRMNPRRFGDSNAGPTAGAGRAMTPEPPPASAPDSVPLPRMPPPRADNEQGSPALQYAPIESMPRGAKSAPGIPTTQSAQAAIESNFPPGPRPAAAEAQVASGIVAPSTERVAPDRMQGTLTVGDRTFGFASGGRARSRGALPYGAYTVGRLQPTRTIGPALALAGADDVPDPRYPGAPRSALFIHSAKGPATDIVADIVSAGCLAIPPSQYDNAVAAIDAMRREHGDVVLQVTPDGATIIPASQYTGPVYTADGMQQFVADANAVTTATPSEDASPTVNAVIATAAEPMALSPGGRDSIIRTVYGEAGGEGPLGQQGVVNVIFNRAHSGAFSSDPGEVVSQTNSKGQKQFNGYNSELGNGLSPDSPAYQQIAAMVDEAVAGTLPDVTGGATYFHADHVSPSWSKRFDRTATIGNHLFYAPPGSPGNARGKPAPAATEPRTLRRDMQGEDVRALQAALKDRGYYAGRLDAKFGPQTEAAVRAYEAATPGLTVDRGVAGPQVLGSIGLTRTPALDWSGGALDPHGLRLHVGDGMAALQSAYDMVARAAGDLPWIPLAPPATGWQRPGAITPSFMPVPQSTPVTLAESSPVSDGRARPVADMRLPYVADDVARPVPDQIARMVPEEAVTATELAPVTPRLRPQPEAATPERFIADPNAPYAGMQDWVNTSNSVSKSLFPTLWSEPEAVSPPPIETPPIPRLRRNGLIPSDRPESVPSSGGMMVPGASVPPPPPTHGPLFIIPAPHSAGGMMTPGAAVPPPAPPFTSPYDDPKWADVLADWKARQPPPPLAPYVPPSASPGPSGSLGDALVPAYDPLASASRPFVRPNFGEASPVVADDWLQPDLLQALPGVASHTSTDRKFDYSTGPSDIDLVAPGMDAWSGGAYGFAGSPELFGGTQPTSISESFDSADAATTFAQPEPFTQEKIENSAYVPEMYISGGATEPVVAPPTGYFNPVASMMSLAPTTMATASAHPGAVFPGKAPDESVVDVSPEPPDPVAGRPPGPGVRTAAVAPRVVQPPPIPRPAPVRPRQNFLDKMFGGIVHPFGIGTGGKSAFSFGTNPAPAGAQWKNSGSGFPYFTNTSSGFGGFATPSGQVFTYPLTGTYVSPGGFADMYAPGLSMPGGMNPSTIV